LQKRFGSGARAKASAVAERAVFIMTASPWRSHASVGSSNLPLIASRNN
jgi:hypothetical protein